MEENGSGVFSQDLKQSTVKLTITFSVSKHQSPIQSSTEISFTVNVCIYCDTEQNGSLSIRKLDSG